MHIGVILPSVHAAAGASYLIMGFAGGDWRQQCELLAEAAARSN